MPDKSAAPAAKTDRQRARARRWLILFPFGFVVGGAAALAWWHNSPVNRPPNSQPSLSLEGKLTVLVRPADRKIDPISIDQPGALPVVSGGAMCIDAQLGEPAFIYLVWIDPQGRVLPLYPWNNETLEVTDVNESPPTRRATKLVFSPLLGRAWTFGDQPGMETVVVLARRTPLPSDVHLDSFFEELSSDDRTQMLDRRAVVTISKGSPIVKMTGLSGESQGGDLYSSERHLRGLIDRLRLQFEFVEAIQFPHKPAATSLPAEKTSIEEG